MALAITVKGMIKMRRNQIWIFLLNAVLLMFVAAWAVSVTYKYDFRLFILLLSIVSLLSITFIVQLIIAKKNVFRFISKIDKRVGKATSEALYFYPSASVIINENGVILWYNKYFCDEIFAGSDVYGFKLDEVVDIDLNMLLSTRAAYVTYLNKAYKVYAAETDNHGSKLYMLSFNDITDYVFLQNKYNMSRPSVLLITIDNYEDLLMNAKETEKAHVSVAIEQLLEEFMAPTTGILRKLANDRFIAVLEERHLQLIINERFKILDKARTIIVGERTSLTLSIGVGHNAETLSESEGYAKQSLDMALGRGGDQAVVKTESGFKFFGGVSKGIEKKSRSKTRIIATAMKEIIQASEKVFIMGHRFGDLDSIGSAIGLAGAVNSFGSEAYVVFDKENNLAKSLIKKFTASEGDEIFMSVHQALSAFTENSLLIIVDTHNKDFLESRELYEKARNIVVIDHHRKTVNFIDNAVIFHHEPYASSAAEMVTEIIQYFLDGGKIPSAYAEALLAGITLDTKNFVMKTGVRTFEAAAALRRMGADTVSVKKLFASSIGTYQSKSKLVANAELYNRCAIVTSDISTQDIKIIAPQAADELLGIDGVDASFVIFKYANEVNISARSLGSMNVQVIMEELGGGGHQTMAAVQMSGITVEEAKTKLIKVIEDKLAS